VCSTGLYFLESKLVGVSVDFYRIAFGEFAGEKLSG